MQIAGTEAQEHERLMVVPLGARGAVEGAMAVWRTGGQPFDQRDLEFLMGLTRQATVALHNARLFNETREALASQTATADVLRVISDSPTNVQPVFDAIVCTASRLIACEAVGLPAQRRTHFYRSPTLRPASLKIPMVRRAFPSPMTRGLTGRVILR